MTAKRFGFLLIDDFALMSFASAVEPLRAANVLSGRLLYEWPLVSIGRRTIVASSGMSLTADHTISDKLRYDAVFVCAGGTPSNFKDVSTMRWLRRQAHAGSAIGGVSGGPFILAKAGLLDGYRCTIHWEHLEPFTEAFPNLTVTRNLFEIDRLRLTCSGGVAALDMMHAIVQRDHGPQLASRVSDWFLQPSVRLGTSKQRLSLRERVGTRSRSLLKAIELMERRIVEPPPRASIARTVGISVRQLERLFARELGTSIDRYRQSIRLDKARSMIRQTDLKIVQIGLDCGFRNASHFARVYRGRFGVAPSKDRFISG